jgi:hypothetical protein
MKLEEEYIQGRLIIFNESCSQVCAVQNTRRQDRYIQSNWELICMVVVSRLWRLVFQEEARIRSQVR